METKQEKNIAIAKMMGWYQEEGNADSWYVKSGNAIVVAYSQYNDSYRELPFHKDWNFLQEARFRVTELLNVKILDKSFTWGGDSFDYEVDVAKIGKKDWEYENWEMMGNMTPIELMFEVVASLSAEYNNLKEK